MLCAGGENSIRIVGLGTSSGASAVGPGMTIKVVLEDKNYLGGPSKS